MTTQLASKVRKGDLLIFQVSNGRTLATVDAVEHGSEADTAPPGALPDPKPMVRLQLCLARPVLLPDLNWPTRYWTAWHYPEELVEVYDRREARGAR